MARKTILADLMGQGADRLSVDPPRSKTPAIGAVSKSLADLKARAVIEIDPESIDAGGLRDRLGQDDAAHSTLVESLRTHGQQVPILVRPHPTAPDRYQIVYGRRRLRALQSLNKPVKAIIRDMDDEALVIAQGQENSARLDLTFIEKVNFARQMREAGYKGTAIAAALSVDKTVVSRMLKVSDAIPVALVEAIGPAPGIGRPRWMALAAALGGQGGQHEDVVAALAEMPDRSSDARFDHALKALSIPVAAPAPQAPKKASDVTVKEIDGYVTLTLPKTTFSDWLVKTLPKLQREHEAR